MDAVASSRVARGLARYGLDVQQRVAGAFRALDDGAKRTLGDLEFERVGTRFLGTAGGKGAQFLSRFESDRLRQLLRAGCPAGRLAAGATTPDCTPDDVVEDFDEFGSAVRRTDEAVVRDAGDVRRALPDDLKGRYTELLLKASDEEVFRFFARFDGSEQELAEYLRYVNDEGISPGTVRSFTQKAGAEDAAEFVSEVGEADEFKTIFGIARSVGSPGRVVGRYIRDTGEYSYRLIEDLDVPDNKNTDVLDNLYRLSSDERRQVPDVVYQTKLRGDGRLVSDSLQGEPGKILRGTLFDSNNNVDSFDDLRVIAEDPSDGTISYVGPGELNSNGRYILGYNKIELRHVTYDYTLQSSGDSPTTLFPLGRRVQTTRDGIQPVTRDSATETDLYVAYREAVESGPDTIRDDGRRVYNYNYDRNGIGEVRVVRTQGGRPVTYFPVNGEQVVRWNPNYDGNGNGRWEEWSQSNGWTEWEGAGSSSAVYMVRSRA